MLKRKTNGAWSDVGILKKKINGAWSDCSFCKKKVSGAWSIVWMKSWELYLNSGQGSVGDAGASAYTNSSYSSSDIYSYPVLLNTNDIVSINLSANVGQAGSQGSQVSVYLTGPNNIFFFSSTTTGFYSTQTYTQTINTSGNYRLVIFVYSGDVTNYNYSSAYVNWIQVNGFQVFP